MAFAASINDKGAVVADNEDDIVAAAITKVVQMPQGTAVPTALFTFDVDAVTVDDVAAAQANPAMPTIDPVDLTLTSAVTPVGPTSGSTSYYVQSDNILAGVDFPHAGVYVYTVTEEENTNGGTGGIDTDTAHQTLSYSQASYTMTVYVDNTKAGGTYVYAVGVEADTKDDGTVATGKVDPTPGGNGSTYTYSQMAFTNTYVHTNGAADPGDPDPYTDSTLSVSKNVDGLFASQDQYFDFTLTLAVPTEVTPVPAYYKAYVVGSTGDVIDPANNVGAADAALIGTDQTTNGYSYIEVSTSDPTDIMLKHGQTLVFVNTPVGTGYTVTENDPTGYVPSFLVTTNGDTPLESTQGTLSTELSTGDQLVGEATNATVFTNTRDLITPTGLSMSVMPFVGLIGLAGAGLVAFVVVKSRKRVAVG